MKKGFTIIEALVTIVILAILAVIVLPVFTKGIRRAELKEVKNMVELTRAGAKYYDFKYDITALKPGGTMPDGSPVTQDNLWDALKIESPSDAKCEYNIINAGATGRQLEVRRKNSDGTTNPIYTYDLPEGPGQVITGTGDEQYLENLP